MNTVMNLPVSFDPYLRLGWHLVPIEKGSKGPRLPGWNKKQNTITQSNQMPQGYGVGLAHAYSGTMALDIDRWDDAVANLDSNGINLQSLYDAPDAVVINSGNPGHGKLLYAMPFGLVLPSKKLMTDTAEGYKVNFLDFRCGTLNGLTCQDVLPPSIHPITCKPYQWGGRGSWERLPMIPSALLNYWNKLLTEDTVRSIGVKGGADASWDEIKTALTHLPPDIGRDEWVSVGMALHYAGTQTDQVEQALALWDEWSSEGKKYQGVQDIQNCWRSFKANDHGVKLGTLFHLAKQHGWTRPIPNVTHLFTRLSPVSPVDLLNGLRVSPPVADLSLFPKVLAQRCDEVSYACACDPLVPLFAGLGAICAAADSRTRLELMTGYKVAPVLWLMSIGSPGDKKSPGSRPMLEVLADMEREDRPRYAAELLNWEALESMHSSSKKAYLQASAQPEAALNVINGKPQDLPTVHELPAQPVQLRFTVSDVTSQKLVRMCGIRPRGLLCHLDEMKSWMDKVSNPSSTEGRSTWTEAYECKSHNMDRVADGKTSGDLSCDHLAVSIYGNVQPKIIKKNIDGLSTDGLLQRFIPAILSGTYDGKPNDVPEFMTNQAEWNMLVRQVYSLQPTTYRLSSGARIVFDQWQDWYYQMKKDERILQSCDAFIESISKLESTYARLMLVCHLIESPYDPQVSGELAQRVGEFIKTYIVPSLRYLYEEVAEMAGDSIEKWLIDHIAHICDQPTVTLRELKRSARRRLADVQAWQQSQTIIDGMTYLEQIKWVIKIEENKQTTVWAIDPRILSDHAEYRAMVAKARQRQLDQIINTSRGRKDGTPRKLVRGYDPDTMDD